MALKIHNLKVAILHALLDYSINKDAPEYLQKRNQLLKRLENMGMKS